MKVLVTSGATREPIDSVRFVSNLSSGRTGAAICDALVTRGMDVTHVHGVDSAVSIRVARREAFTDHLSLDMILRRHLRDRDYGAVVHAAAVGDFSVDGTPSETKIESGKELTVRLKPTPKIIERIRGYAGAQDLLLVGFKLTHDPDPENQARAARELLLRSHARFVVQNDVSTLESGDGHIFAVHESGGRGVRRYVGRIKLAVALAALIEEHLKRNAR